MKIEAYNAKPVLVDDSIDTSHCMYTHHTCIGSYLAPPPPQAKKTTIQQKNNKVYSLDSNSRPKNTAVVMPRKRYRRGGKWRNQITNSSTYTIIHASSVHLGDSVNDFEHYIVTVR